MATCEKREIVQPKPPVEYVLTLSAQEAAWLAWATTGYSADGEAKPLFDIHNVLKRQGVVPREW